MARWGVLVAVIAVAVIAWRWHRRDSEPAAADASHAGAPDAGAAPDDPASAESAAAVRARQTAKLQAIRAGLERARMSGGKATDSGEPAERGPDLTVAEKRAAFAAWKERVSKALSDDLHPLVTECLELVELPDLDRFDLSAEFEISGLPGVGSVVHSARIVEEETNVKIPELSECFRESAYVVDIEPPPIPLDDEWSFGLRRINGRTIFMTTNISIDNFEDNK